MSCSFHTTELSISFFTSFQMRFNFFFNHFCSICKKKLVGSIRKGRISNQGPRTPFVALLLLPFEPTCKILHCRPFKLGMLSAFEVKMFSFEVPTLRYFQGFVQIHLYKYKYKYVFAFGFPASVAKISVLLLPRGN